MNTREIEYFLSTNEKISKISHGVYAADMLPKQKIEKLPKYLLSTPVQVKLKILQTVIGSVCI